MKEDEQTQPVAPPQPPAPANVGPNPPVNPDPNRGEAAVDQGNPASWPSQPQAQ